MKKKVIVKGPALSASGYGEHARLVLRALKSNEELFDIYLVNIPWGKTGWISESSEERTWLDSLIIKTHEALQAKQTFDISLQVTIPNEFEKMALVNIGVTAGIESHKVAPQWLQKANEMDKIITISEHSKRGFTETKYPLVNEQKEHVADLTCNVPVEVIGYPVKNIKPADVQFDFDTDFNFLSVALWGQRKNMEQTVRAFVEQFRDNENVGLILKTALANGSTYDKEAMRQVLANVLQKCGERKCKVYLLHGRLSEEEMTTLLTHDKVKCMFSLAHGEGFGLPLFEAAYNGLPIVATDWSGHLDFLYAPQKDKKGKTKNKGLFGKVSYDLNNVQKESVWEGVIVPDSKWAYPSLQSAKTKIGDVYKDYDLALSKAKKLKEYVLEEFEESKIIKKYISLIDNRKEEILKTPKKISFCIITDGKKKEKTDLEIKSIMLAVDKSDIESEIILCGNVENFKDTEGVQLVSAPDLADAGLLGAMRNKAAASATGDVYVFVDDDILFSENWVNRLKEYSENNPWNILGSRLLLPDGDRCWDRSTISPHRMIDYDTVDYSGILYQTGAYWIVRKDTFKNNSWDPNIPIYAEKNGGINEDVEYSIRLQKEGYILRFDKENIVWHNDDSYCQIGELCLRKEVTDLLVFKDKCEEFLSLAERMGD